MEQNTFFNMGKKSTMTSQEYLKKYFELKDRAMRVVDSNVERQRKLCKQAGLDPSLLGIHPHNAMISYKEGKPWKNVNYDLVRKIIWMQSHQWDALRIVDEWARKNDPLRNGWE